MEKTILIFTGLILFSIMTQAQTDANIKSLTIKLKVNIISLISVGWGDIYKGTIDEVIEGNKLEIPDTIKFGITASKTFEYLKVGDKRIISFENSKEINKNKYLPPQDCMVSKLNEIWLITKIEK